MGLFDLFGNFYNGNLFGNNGNSSSNSNNSNNNSGMQNFAFINSLIWPTASTPRPASPAQQPRKPQPTPAQQPRKPQPTPPKQSRPTSSSSSGNILGNAFRRQAAAPTSFDIFDQHQRQHHLTADNAVSSCG